jgi:hypothetical protein
MNTLVRTAPPIATGWARQGPRSTTGVGDVHHNRATSGTRAAPSQCP